MSLHTDLGLTDANTTCGCATHAPAEHGAASAAAAAQETAPPATWTQDYFVAGMTCSHCVASVTEELSELAAVESVTVELTIGGDSRVTVVGAAPLEQAAVRAAIQEAGYQLADPAR
jgi:copper chaperone